MKRCGIFRPAVPGRSLGLGLLITLLISVPDSSNAMSVEDETPPSLLLFGDTHLHTSWSPDAYLTGNRTAGPDVAYRYAKGLPVAHPGHGARVQIETPLDFLAVSDHAEFMGVVPMIFADDPRVAASASARTMRKLTQEGRIDEAFGILLGQIFEGRPDPALRSETITRDVWNEIINAAERHNNPGTFTTLLAWEWSSMPDQANLHRIVLSPDGAEVAKRFVPFSSFDSQEPEGLWQWLAETSRRTGARFLAIPHNSNISKGLMFAPTRSDGEPIDAAYAQTRARWERVVEVTQIKGDSETHPRFSPTDEFADFEPFGDEYGYEAQSGDYAREALRTGLSIEARIGTNPFQFGMIGATDAHTSVSSAEEDNFHGKFAAVATPAQKMAPRSPNMMAGSEVGAAGLAAVWAEANTREAIFAAFERREVYATTGPRIAVRFFGGWDFDDGELEDPDWAKRAYTKGVPMGGELSVAPAGKSASFLISAQRDPRGANLDRIQVVKGWVDRRGETHERVFDVAWSATRVDGSGTGSGRDTVASGRRNASGRLDPVGSTVDLASATYTNTIGASVLTVAWRDPEFDAGLSAFYYVRVLQIPTPRHSLYDAIAIGVPHPANRPRTLQERAYSSPIWYRPAIETTR